VTDTDLLTLDAAAKFIPNADAAALIWHACWSCSAKPPG